MLDDTLGPALVAPLGEGEWAPTVDLQVQFLRPPSRDESSGAAGSCVGGKDVGFLAGELVGPDGQVLATATASAIIRRR
jgi:acyl-coenzyme A thioesterase PaaI-like protein